MERRKEPTIWSLVLFVALAVVMACGTGTPVEEEVVDIDAIGTSIAEGIFATQTAEAPMATSTKPPEPTESATETPEPSPEPSDTPEPTKTNTPRPTNTPQPTATKEPDVVVTASSINLRAGPGTAYGVVGTLQQGDTASVKGHAYDCSWLKVTTASGVEGWVTGGAQYVEFNLRCADVSAATIPPTPTAAVSPTSPAPPTAVRATVKVLVENNTSGTLTLHLNGPANYTFTIQPGNHYIDVVPGSYSYTGYGCGGASKTGSMTFSSGDVWEWWCT